jgi:hypothetical protein
MLDAAMRYFYERACDGLYTPDDMLAAMVFAGLLGGLGMLFVCAVVCGLGDERRRRGDLDE